jgi:LmbE family N-acetylglucosaminyl deacetylase
MPYLYEIPSKKFLSDVKVINGIEKKKILAFAPHSDDLSIGAGGFLAHLARKNTIVPVCAYTGWRGVNSRFSKEKASLTRENEMKKEAKILGAKNPVFLRLKTYESDFKEDKIFDTKKIGQLIKKQNPGLIFLPNALDLHPRHKLLTKLILSSLSELKAMPAGRQAKKVGLVFYEIPWSVFSSNEFNFIVPLSKDLAKKKIDAIKAHKSQLVRTNFVKLAKSLMSLRAGMVPEQKLNGYGSKSSFSNWVEVYKYKVL